MECALVDNSNTILERSTSAGAACPPDPIGKGWRWLPIIEEATPSFDPITQKLDGPFEQVLASSVRRFWTAIALSAPEIAENQRVASYRSDTSRIDLLQRLRSATPAQIETWVDTNASNLAQARNILKAIIKVIALDTRD